MCTIYRLKTTYSTKWFGAKKTVYPVQSRRFFHDVRNGGAIAGAARGAALSYLEG